MDQLFLWDEPSPQSSSSVVANHSDGAPGTVAKENKAALKCHSSADAMQKHIDAKHQSANNMLAMPPTRKRLGDADGLRKQAIRLERIQATLRHLAEMHSNGTISPALASLTTRAAIENALFTSPCDSAFYALYNAVSRDERNEERVLRLTNEAATLNIPGYFPTPPQLATRLIETACIEPGNTILEPSAGGGNLIDAILSNQPNAQISYCELNCFLLDILRYKYEKVKQVTFIGRDCLEIDEHRLERRFDRVIMNPPFERGEDADHVLHAWHSLLAPKGILTAIVSAGIFFRSDKKAQSFREFLTARKAVINEVPAGSFKSSGTGIETKIVQLRACR
jgi:phospholipid N-methyltransferase